MVDIDTGRRLEDREFFQELFTNREVQASKFGVLDVVEEIEEFESVIERVPWGNFTDEERVSIATPAISSISNVFGRAANEGKIDMSDALKITTQFAMVLFNSITLTEDPFGGTSLDLIKSRL